MMVIGDVTKGMLMKNAYDIHVIGIEVLINDTISVYDREHA